jgi:hypothetical protein
MKNKLTGMAIWVRVNLSSHLFWNKTGETFSLDKYAFFGVASMLGYIMRQK